MLSERKAKSKRQYKTSSRKWRKPLSGWNKIKNQHQTTGEAIADLLKYLKLAKPEAMQLAKQFKISTPSYLPILLPQLHALLDKYLATDNKEKAHSSFSLNLFGSNKNDIELSESPLPIKDDFPVSGIGIQVEEPQKNRPPSHLILMQLLERLSLPKDLTKRTTKIRHQIQAGINEQDLPKVIDEIADIISALGTQVTAEKKEYETILKIVNNALEQIR